MLLSNKTLPRGKFDDNCKLVIESLDNILSNPLYGSYRGLIRGHKKEITSMLFYENDILITCSIDLSIKKWDLGTQSLKIKIEKAHDLSINSIIIIKNLNCLISGSDDGKIKFWKIDDMKEYSKEIDTKTKITTIIQSDEKTILVASNDMFIKYYDIDSKEAKKEIFTYHTKPINLLVIFKLSNGINLILSASEDKTISVYDLKTTVDMNNKLGHHYGGIKSLIQLKFDEKIIISADDTGRMLVWEYEKNLLRKKYVWADNFTWDKGLKIYKINLLELTRHKMLLFSMSASILIFFDLSVINEKFFQLIRRTNLIQGLDCLITNSEENYLIFNIGQDIVLWK